MQRPEDFTQLYRQYAGLVRNVIFQLSGATMLDDLVQEAFLKIWRGLARFRHQAQLKTWIYRVSYNVAVDYLRGRQFQSNSVTSVGDVPLAVLTVPSGEQQFIERQLVEQGVRELSMTQREVLVLCCFQELALNETAEILNIPEGTVKSRLHEAKRRMVEILKKQGMQR